jgi:hypothetical protein
LQQPQVLSENDKMPVLIEDLHFSEKISGRPILGHKTVFCIAFFPFAHLDYWHHSGIVGEQGRVAPGAK